MGRKGPFFRIDLGKVHMNDGIRPWPLNEDRVETLRRMYETYGEDMVTLAGALVRDKSGAEDIVHDVFVALARSANPMGTIRNLKGYLMTCVANRAREYLASRKHPTAELAVEPAADYRNPIDNLIDDEAHRQLIAAMDQLPYEQQEAILLHLRGELTFKEIAENQNTSINTVQGRYRYGLEKLRVLLNDKVKVWTRQTT